jgi:hypothetical protein
LHATVYTRQPGGVVARWRRGDSVPQAEPGTSAKGHLADGTFCIYKYQLATQVDRQQDSCFHSMHTCLLRATRMTLRSARRSHLERARRNMNDGVLFGMSRTNFLSGEAEEIYCRRGVRTKLPKRLPLPTRMARLRSQVRNAHSSITSWQHTYASLKNTLSKSSSRLSTPSTFQSSIGMV